MKKTTFLLAAIAGTTSAFGGGWVLFDNGEWHFSVGAAYDSGAKIRLTENQHATYTSPFQPGDTAASAKEKAEGVQRGSRIYYPNGAWIDPTDPGMGGTDQPGMTGWYRIPGGPGENGQNAVFALGSAAYSEVTTYGADAGSQPHYASDDNAEFGLYAEISHGLYKDEEHHWGVDIALGFQYFMRNNAYRSSSSWNSGSSLEQGTYSSQMAIPDSDNYWGDKFSDPEENWNWRSDASGDFYGSGEPDEYGEYGYAAPISPGWVSSSLSSVLYSDSACGSMSSRGDYRNLELMFMLKPYYDVTDWFRIVATVGLVLGRQSFDFSTTMIDDGVRSRHERDFNQWDLYGIAGLGAVFRYKDFTLGFDFLARFGDDDMTIEDRYVYGTVQRGRWMLRAGIGYEF